MNNKGYSILPQRPGSSKERRDAAGIRQEAAHRCYCYIEEGQGLRRDLKEDKGETLASLNGRMFQAEV